MRIERIEKSKHKQERVLVFLEGGDLLRITGVELLRFGLHKDMELPEELVEKLRRSAERSETKARAARLASSRMLSKKELSDRLVKKGTERGEAEELADWLEDLGAVDDAAYAGVIARHYGTMGYGPARVCQELRRRGIGRDLWEDALAQLPPAAEKRKKRHADVVYNICSADSFHRRRTAVPRHPRSQIRPRRQHSQTPAADRAVRGHTDICRHCLADKPDERGRLSAAFRFSLACLRFYFHPRPPFSQTAV